MTFNLHAYVREFLAATDEPDPKCIAAAIADSLTPEQALDAVRIMLPSYVNVIVNQQASTNRRAPLPTLPQTTPKARTTPIMRERIAKMFADNAAKLRQDRVMGTDHAWMILNTATVADVRAAAQYRYNLALENKSAGTRFEKLAARMEEVGAKTVADLSDEDLVTFYGSPS